MGDGRDRKLSDTNMINMRQEVCFQGWISTETSSPSQAHWCMSKQKASSIKHSIVNNYDVFIVQSGPSSQMYIRIFIQACHYLVSLSLLFFCLKTYRSVHWKENNVAHFLLSCSALCLCFCMKVLAEATGSKHCVYAQKLMQFR